MSKVEQSAAPQDTGLEVVVRESERATSQSLMSLLGARRLRTLLANVMQPNVPARDIVLSDRLVIHSGGLPAAIGAGATGQQNYTLPWDGVLTAMWIQVPTVTVANTITFGMFYLPSTSDRIGGTPYSPPLILCPMPGALRPFTESVGLTTGPSAVAADLPPDGLFMRQGSILRWIVRNNGAAAASADHNFYAILSPLAERS